MEQVLGWLGGGLGWFGGVVVFLGCTRTMSRTFGTIPIRSPPGGAPYMYGSDGPGGDSGGPVGGSGGPGGGSGGPRRFETLISYEGFSSKGSGMYKAFDSSAKIQCQYNAVKGRCQHPRSTPNYSGVTGRETPLLRARDRPVVLLVFLGFSGLIIIGQ